MAPGDLNLKKSWYPKLMKNQAKVWEMEQQLLAEHKKIQERQLEFEKEKERKELIDLQIKANPNLLKKLVSNKIDWMYDDPTKNSNKDDLFLSDKDKDDFLLGKKKLGPLMSSGKRGGSGSDTGGSAGGSTGERKNKSWTNDRLAGLLAMGKPASTTGSMAKPAVPRKDLDSLDPMLRFKQQDQVRRQQVLRREKLLKERESRESSRVRPEMARKERQGYRERDRDPSRREQGYRERDERYRR